MADELVTVIRIEGDGQDGLAMLKAFRAALGEVAVEANSSFARVAQATDALNTSLKRTATTTKQTETEFEKAQRQALAYAQAQARLLASHGDLHGAQETLRKALSDVSAESLASIRAQTQLANTQSQIVNAAKRAQVAVEGEAKALEKSAAEKLKAERAALQYAQAVARQQAASGNLAAAEKTLTDALAGVTQGTLAAVRAQTQLAHTQARIQALANGTNFGKLLGDLRTSINAFNASGASGLNQFTVRVQSIIQLIPQLTGGANAMGGALSGVGSAGAAGAAGLGVLTIGVGAFIAAAAAAVAIGAKVTQVLVSIGETGVQTNAQFESIRLGIATVIASVAELQNSDGVSLKGIDELNSAIPIAADQMRKLRIDALETSATIGDIAPAFQAAIGPGLVAGLTIDQIRENTIKLTQAVTALGLPLDQIKQETRAILSGDINRNTQAAVALGITREAALEAQKEGKFAEFLNQKLEAAAAAGKLVAQTFAAASSNLQEAGDTFQAVVTEGLFNQLRDSLNKVLPQIFDKNQANLISKNFSGIADTLTRIFDTAGADAARLIEFVINGVKEISAFLDRNRETVGGIIASANEIIVLIAETVAGIADILLGSQDTGKELEKVNGLLKLAVGIVGLLSDSIKIGVSGFLTMGNTIKLVVVAPLEAALTIMAAITSFLPGVGSAVEGFRKQLQLTRESATKGLVENAKDFSQSITNIGKSTSDSLKRIEEAQRRAKLGQRAVAGVETKQPGAFTGKIKAPPRPKDKDGEKGAEAERRRVLQAELKSIQLQEKNAELANKRQTNALKQSLTDRLISLETYTELAIQLEAELRDAKLKTLAEEEKAAIKLARNPAEKAEKQAEFALKRQQLEQETDIAIEGFRDELRRTDEKAEEDHQDKLFDIRQAAREREERAIEEAVRQNRLSPTEGAQQLIEIERQAFADREAQLQRDLENARENVQQRQAINDQLALLASQRADFEIEASQRVRNAQAEEAKQFTDFIKARVDALKTLRAAQLAVLDQQAELLQKSFATRRQGAAQGFENDRERARQQAADAQQAINVQFNQTRQAAEAARASAATINQIEIERNQALEAERTRHVEAMRQISERQAAFEASTGGGLQSLFSQRVNQMALDMGLFKATLDDFATKVEDSIVSLDEIAGQAFFNIADGLGSIVQNYVLLGKTGPAVIRKLLAEQLAAISKEATVNAIKQLALGFASLFLNPAEAAGHFTSAALWAALAGGSALVGRAVAPKEGGGGAGGTTPEQQEKGTRTIEQGGQLPTEQPRQQAQPLPQIQPTTLNISFRAKMEEGVIIDKWVADFENNGRTRKTTREDMVKE